MSLNFLIFARPEFRKRHLVIKLLVVKMPRYKPKHEKDICLGSFRYTINKHTALQRASTA